MKSPTRIPRDNHKYLPICLGFLHPRREAVGRREQISLPRAPGFLPSSACSSVGPEASVAHRGWGSGLGDCCLYLVLPPVLPGRYFSASSLLIADHPPRSGRSCIQPFMSLEHQVQSDKRMTLTFTPQPVQEEQKIGPWLWRQAAGGWMLALPMTSLNKVTQTRSVSVSSFVKWKCWNSTIWICKAE